MKPCTSNYAVEARASAWESAAKSLRTPAHKSVPFGRNVARLLDEAAALLRALVAEREATKEADLTYMQRLLADIAMKGAATELTAYARGFREGAEQMREAAAGRMHRIAENERATKPYAQNDDHVMRIEDTAFALDQHGRAIRALPLPEPQA